ncbi:MAG: hypothetical protein IMZ50_10260, partial [Candidatus Atribacteria bacterium]|nr:hypothetical protein [Candidatus Atribacteria bacterium]
MFTEIILTVDDLSISDWESLIRELPEKTCNRYCEAFHAAAKAARDRGEQKLQQILTIFGSITSMMLQPAEKDELFVPMITLADGNRTAIISDFTEQQFDAFRAWLPNCHDAELKARIADVIWTQNHQGNFQVAETAVESYLASGEHLLLGEFPYLGIQRITRSLHLAASLGRRSKWFPKIIEHIEELIERYAKEYADFTVEFMELL